MTKLELIEQLSRLPGNPVVMTTSPIANIDLVYQVPGEPDTVYLELTDAGTDNANRDE